MKTHFQHITLTTDQQKAVEQLTQFLDSDKHIFMLKGYAGKRKHHSQNGFID